MLDIKNLYETYSLYIIPWNDIEFLIKTFIQNYNDF